VALGRTCKYIKFAKREEGGINWEGPPNGSQPEGRKGKLDRRGSGMVGREKCHLFLVVEEREAITADLGTFVQLPGRS